MCLTSSTTCWTGQLGPASCCMHPSCSTPASQAVSAAQLLQMGGTYQERWSLLALVIESLPLTDLLRLEGRQPTPPLLATRAAAANSPLKAPLPDNKTGHCCLPTC